MSINIESLLAAGHLFNTQILINKYITLLLKIMPIKYVAILKAQRQQMPKLHLLLTPLRTPISHAKLRLLPMLLQQLDGFQTGLKHSTLVIDDEQHFIHAYSYQEISLKKKKCIFRDDVMAVQKPVIVWVCFISKQPVPQLIRILLQAGGGVVKERLWEWVISNTSNLNSQKATRLRTRNESHLYLKQLDFRKQTLFEIDSLSQIQIVKALILEHRFIVAARSVPEAFHLFLALRALFAPFKLVHKLFVVNQFNAAILSQSPFPFFIITDHLNSEVVEMMPEGCSISIDLQKGQINKSKIGKADKETDFRISNFLKRLRDSSLDQWNQCTNRFWAQFVQHCSKSNSEFAKEVRETNLFFQMSGHEYSFSRVQVQSKEVDLQQGLNQFIQKGKMQERRLSGWVQITQN